MLRTVESTSEASATDLQRPSKALPLLLGQLSEDQKKVVLDLGGAMGANVRYLSRYSCKLYIADLFATLLHDQPASLEDPEVDFLSRCEEALDLDSRDRVDLILAWDLFDYLRPDQIRSLAALLGPYCHENTVLFALASYHKQISARPGSYEILSHDTLLYHPTGIALRSSPQHKEPDLERALTGFEVEQSFLLRHGQHEYLFVRQRDETG